MESLLREYEAFCAAETERYDKRKQTKDDYVFRRKGMKLPMTPSTFGGKSGWMYSVNGSAPNVSCGKYVLKDGDTVSWYYVK